MKSFSSKSILERVRKIERKYTKPNQIRDDSEDEDLTLQEKDFNIGGKIKCSKRYNLSQLQGKEISQATSNRTLSKLNILGLDVPENGNKHDIHDPSISTLKYFPETHSEVDYRKDLKSSKQEKKLDFKDLHGLRHFYLQGSNETSSTMGVSDSPLYEKVNQVEIEASPASLTNPVDVSNYRLQMNINLKLEGEELDEMISSPEKYESDISEDLSNLHLNILPFEDLVKEDYLKDINFEDRKNDHCVSWVPKEIKDTDDNNSLSVKTSSVSFAKEMKSDSNNSASLNKSHSSQEDRLCLYDLNCENLHLNTLPFKDNLKGSKTKALKNDHDPGDLPEDIKDTDDNSLSVSFSKEIKSFSNSIVSLNKTPSSQEDGCSLYDNFSNLNVNIFNIEDLIVSVQGGSDDRLQNEILSDKCQLENDNDIKLLPLTEYKKKEETESRKTFSLSDSTSLPSNVITVEESASNVTSPTNKDIKGSDTSVNAEIISDHPNHQAINSIYSVDEEIDISRKLSFTGNKSIPRIHYGVKDVHEELNGNNGNLTLTRNLCFKTMRDVEEQDSIVEKSNSESTTINEDIEEDLDFDEEPISSLNNTIFQHNTIPKDTFQKVHHVSSSSLSTLSHNFHKSEFKENKVYKQTFSKDSILKSKTAKALKTEIKNENHEVKINQEKKPENNIGSYRKHKQRAQKTAVSVSKSPAYDECIRRKNVCDVSSQTNIGFFPDKNYEFDKKMEEIFRATFINTPNLLNTQSNINNVVAEDLSSQDLFSPSERGFHWALKQQVELTRHFIQAEYNMYATCMNAIRELSANYKPTSVNKSRKRKK